MDSRGSDFEIAGDIDASPGNNIFEQGKLVINSSSVIIADGANAGKYVFLRLSWSSGTLASGWDAYKITTREAGTTFQTSGN